MSASSRVWIWAGVVAVATASASPARADDASAEALFDRGRKLLEKASTVDEACRLFQESLRLAERGDTLMNLAECHRRQGKTATAWSEFDRALRIGDKLAYTEAILIARNARDYLAGRLSKLYVTVTPETAALPELTVLVNGAPWPKESWNSPTAFDPGPVDVTATAKGYKPFAVHVVVGLERDQKIVPVVLEAEPPPPPPPPPPTPAPAPPPMPIWPWVVGGAGLVMVGLAAGFEVDSRSASSTIDKACGAGRQTCPRGAAYQVVLDARGRETRGFGMFVGLGIGGILSLGAAGVGLGVWARSSRPTVTVSPTSVAFSSSF